jgi:hypothetical protein
MKDEFCLSQTHHSCIILLEGYLIVVTGLKPVTTESRTRFQHSKIARITKCERKMGIL